MCTAKPRPRHQLWTAACLCPWATAGGPHVYLQPKAPCRCLMASPATSVAEACLVSSAPSTPTDTAGQACHSPCIRRSCPATWTTCLSRSLSLTWRRSSMTLWWTATPWTSTLSQWWPSKVSPTEWRPPHTAGCLGRNRLLNWLVAVWSKTQSELIWDKVHLRMFKPQLHLQFLYRQHFCFKNTFLVTSGDWNWSRSAEKASPLVSLNWWRWNQTYFWNIRYSVQTKCQTFCLNVRAKLKHTSLVYSSRLQIAAAQSVLKVLTLKLFTVSPQSNFLYVQRSDNRSPLRLTAWR